MGRELFYDDECSAIDMNFDSIIYDKVDKLNPLSADEYFSSRSIKNKLDVLSRHLSIIDTNTASLLTHISAMIAVLGIMLIVFSDTSFTKYFVLLEMIGYTVLALICVYNLKPGKPIPVSRNDSEESRIGRYYIKRRYVYFYCVNGVMYITVLFIVTLIFHLIGVTLS